MRLNINLASRKYEDVRRFFLRWGIALASLAVLTVLLATLAGFSYVRSEKSGKEIKDLQQKVAALETRRDQLMAIDNSPQNRDVTQQKKFWNEEIRKRNLSWTQLFNDLQRIMPSRAYLNSVQPELTRDNRLKLKIVIAAEKRDDARELETRMEDSARFLGPKIVSETLEKGQKNTAPHWNFEMETGYTPASAMIQPPSAQDARGQSPAADTTPSGSLRPSEPPSATKKER
jgi:Tfp pilus assembly protein PilN